MDAPRRFTARRPFEVYLRNHGEGSHVHIAADDALARAARVRDGTEFLAAGESLRVPVETATVDRPVTGTLTISIGYGAVETTVEVTVAPEVGNEDSTGPVQVSESLGRPADGEPSGRGRYSGQELGLAALAGLAVLVSGWAAVTVRSAVVVGAAAAVVVAVVVAVALSLR